MINTGPMGKSASAMAAAPIDGMAQANAPLAGRTGGGMRAPMRRPPMPMRRPMKAGMGGNVPMSGGNVRRGAAAGGGGVGVMQDPATGAMKVGSPSLGGGQMPPMGPPPQRFDGGPDMGAGPVANTAPPMFAPPDMGGGSDMGMGGGDPMLMDQYMPQNGFRAPRGQMDPRFRY